MSKKKLSTDEMLEKLTILSKYAEDAVASNDFIRRLGAVTVYASIADFSIIQSARLIEQVILKAQLVSGLKPTFIPKEDEYFFDNQVNSKRIVKEIERMLPFTNKNNGENSENAKIANDKAKIYITESKKFLNYRNTLMHHIASPKKTLSEIEELTSKAINAYYNFEIAHKEFLLALQPFRFGQNEIDYFYNSGDE